ncbi:MAG: D-alanyl-D-alanine carboxypeptidase [Peptococcaceae bacterium]|nr:D-alanyl-D-alanine carboxypeptidase [Peptococcaceae bacterium]
MNKIRNKHLGLFIRKNVCWSVVFCVLIIGSCFPGKAMAAVPTIGAKAGIVIDIDSGAVLWEKNPDQALCPASTTKILTAILALDMMEPGSVCYVSPEAAAIGESSIYLQPGEQFYLDQLLTGALVKSGNDACFAIAENVAGSEPLFVHWMNWKGELLGATKATLYNTNGLPHENHMMSARDLAMIGRYAMHNQDFAEKVKTKSTVIQDIGGSERYLKNTNKLLWEDEHVIGVKTGTTDAAGPCLVSAMEKDGRRVLAVVLNSPDRFWESHALLNYGIDEFTNISLCEAGDIMTYLPIDPWLVGIAAGDGVFTVPKYKLKTLETEWVFAEPMELPIASGEPVGYLLVKDDKGKVWGRVDILSQDNMNEKIKGIWGFLAKLNIV